MTLSDLLLFTNPAPSDHRKAFSRAQGSPGRPRKAQEKAFKKAVGATGPQGVCVGTCGSPCLQTLVYSGPKMCRAVLFVRSNGIPNK